MRESEHGIHVRQIEKQMFSWLRNELMMPNYLGMAEMRLTRGWTETFSLEGPSDAEIIARIEAEFARLRAEG